MKMLQLLLVGSVLTSIPLGEGFGAEGNHSDRGYYGNPYFYPPPYVDPYYPYPYWFPPHGGNYPPSQGSYGNQLIPAGRLILIIDPVSSEVYVDGLRLVQHEDLSYEVGLLFGQHQVTVKKEGFEPYDQPVDIPGGQHVFLTIRLKPEKNKLQ